MMKKKLSTINRTRPMLFVEGKDIKERVFGVLADQLEEDD
jgi:hypothetical protein